MKKLLFIISIPFAIAFFGAYLAGGKEALGATMVISMFILLAVVAGVDSK